MSRTRIGIAVVVLCFVASASGLFGQQPQGFLASPSGENSYQPFGAVAARTVIPLDGAWNCSDDGGDSWKPIRIPCSFNDIEELQFRRKFTIPQNLIGKYRWKLVCCGTQYQARITVNNQFIGQHESSLQYTFDIPDGARLAAENTITVETYNKLDYSNTIPIRKLLFGSRTYGGIVRSMYLVGVPKVWIEDVRVQTQGSEAQFKINVVADVIKGMNVGGSSSDTGKVSSETISGDRGEFELAVVMRSTAAANTADTAARNSGGSEAGRGTQTFTLESKRTTISSVSVNVPNAALWSPETPNLYQAYVQIRYQGVLVDERILNVGFRSLTTQGSTVLLNGNPIEIKGVAYIEDSHDVGMSLSCESMRRDMLTIRRDLGANTVRFPDGVPHPYLLQLCDELGLMAIVDVPVGSPSAGLFGDDVFRRRVLDRTRALVEAMDQHPCVVAYGLSAVIPGGNTNAVEAVVQIRRVLDSLDKRLLCASSTDWSNPALRKAVDIAGVHAFDIDPAQLRKTIGTLQSQLHGERPLVVLGYAKAVQLGNRNGYSDPLSYEGQAKYISDVFNIIAELKLAGGVCWSFNDYRTDRPTMTTDNGTEDRTATTGLYALDRSMRPAATMLGALYTDQKIPELPIGSYSSPSPLVFVIVGIVCAIVFLMLINNSRRFREDMTRSLLRPYNFYADIRDQRILSNLQTTLLCAIIATVMGIIVASLCYHYRMDERFDTLLTAVVPDRIKGILDTVIWHPWLGIVTFSLLFFAISAVVAGIIRLCSTFVRSRVFFSDAFAIAVWGALPVLLLIPVAIILYRLLEVSSTGPIAFAAMVAIALWALYRILRGTAVVFDVRPVRTYLYTIGAIVILFLVVFLTSRTVSVGFSYLREGIGKMYGQ